MAIVIPEYGIQGLPTGTKDNLRADFKINEFEKMIEVKGYRLAWERGGYCPCKPISDQAQQPDPNCTLCKGLGWYWFGPDGYVINQEEVGLLTDSQMLILTKNGAAVIKGIMTNLTNEMQPYDKVGNWMAGMTSVTVRYQNKLGYYDRLTNLDSEIVYSEVFTQGSESLVALRYLARGVNILRSETVRYTTDDFALFEGKIQWLPGKAPAKGTRISAHYLTYPTWLIVDHPHTIRGTRIKRKVAIPDEPLGNPMSLPIQATLKYEFLQL